MQRFELDVEAKRQHQGQSVGMLEDQRFSY
jgi:hypothetical protein